MKIRELMQDHTPLTDYQGWVTNDDYVFAINLTPGKEPITKVSEYAVVEMGIAGLDAQLNPITQDKQYIRSGQTTMKTGTQRSFAVTGDRYIGDEAQDYCLSHKQKYGTGNTVVTDYLYFNILNGLGEKGQCSVIVNSDGSGNAGESSAVEIEFKKIGATPIEFTYEGETEGLLELILNSEEGMETGKTLITVDSALASNHCYKYKVAANPTIPDYDTACTTGYTAWDGLSEITASTGQKIVVVVVDTDNKAKAAGMVLAVVKA